MDTLSLDDLVGSTLYVKIDSVRSVKGTLVAIDAQANLLLDNVFERRIADNALNCESGKFSAPSYNVRSLGLVSIPRASVESIKIESAKLDRLVASKKEFMRNVV